MTTTNLNERERERERERYNHVDCPLTTNPSTYSKWSDISKWFQTKLLRVPNAKSILDWPLSVSSVLESRVLLSIKTGYRYRVGPYRVGKVLTNSEILKATRPPMTRLKATLYGSVVRCVPTGATVYSTSSQRATDHPFAAEGKNHNQMG